MNVARPSDREEQRARPRDPYRRAGRAGRVFIGNLTRLADDAHPKVTADELRVALAIVGYLATYSRIEDRVSTKQIATLAGGRMSSSKARRLLQRLHDRDLGFTYVPGKYRSTASHLSLKGCIAGEDLTALDAKASTGSPEDEAFRDHPARSKGVTDDEKGSNDHRKGSNARARRDAHRVVASEQSSEQSSAALARTHTNGEGTHGTVIPLRVGRVNGEQLSEEEELLIRLKPEAAEFTAAQRRVLLDDKGIRSQIAQLRGES